MSEPAHGDRRPSRQTYKDGCRCPECVAHGEAYLAERRATDRRRRQRYREQVEAGLIPEISHGIGGYQRGCRCGTCTSAARDRVAAYRREKAESDPINWDEVAHLKPGAGVRRRSSS